MVQALERESQNVFDYLKTEVTRIKKSIGALSSVVDEELSTLRSECISLRDEVQRVVDLARAQTDNAVALMTESRQRDTEWMQLSFAAVKDSVSKLNADIKDTRSQLFELSASHASAAARREVEMGSGGFTALSDRLAAVEARYRDMAAENAVLKAEHAALVRFATEAKPQVEGLSQGMRAVPSLLEPLQSQATASQAEITRHRDAIALLVETVDTISRNAKAGHEALGARIGEITDVSESRGANHEQAVNGLGADLDALGDVVRRIEARLDEQQQSLSDMGSSASSRVELVRSLEYSVAEMRTHMSQANSGLKTLKLSVKETADALGSHRAQTRRALDELEKRSDVLAKAAGIFSDALKIPNPVSGMGSSLSQLGGALSSRRSSFSVFSNQAET